MSKIPEYRRGYRNGLRWTVSWLHSRAAEMVDVHAKALLNSAATNLGWDIEKQMETIETPPETDDAAQPRPASEGYSLASAIADIEALRLPVSGSNEVYNCALNDVLAILKAQEKSDG